MRRMNAGSEGPIGGGRLFVALCLSVLIAHCARVDESASSQISKLDKIRQAHTAQDGARYRAEVQELLGEARDLESEELVGRLDELVRVSEEVGYEGFELVVVGYIDELVQRPDLDRNHYNPVIARLQESLEPSNCGAFLSVWFRGVEEGGRGRDPAAGFPDEPLAPWVVACLFPDQEVEESDLTDGLVLSAVDGNSDIVPIILDPPQNRRPIKSRPSDPGFDAQIIGQLPEGALRFIPLGNLDKLSIQNNGISDSPSVAPWARSKTFAVRLSRCADTQSQPASCFDPGSITQESSDYGVTLPVNLGIHTRRTGGLFYVLSPGDVFGGNVYASGEEIAVGGQMVWSWNPTQGGPLPSGLTLATTDGNLQISGTVQIGAISSVGRLRLEQGSNSTERDAAFRVVVHFLPEDREAMRSQIHELEREQDFSFQLPQALGGDGQNYVWALESGSSFLSALGLGLVQRGGLWFMEGTVPPTAPLGADTVTLRITSPLGPGTTLPMHFSLSIPFKVWTQNVKLLAEDLISGSDFAALTAACANIFTSAVGCPLLTGAAVAEAAYDSGVPNTDEDNEERLALIVSRALSPDHDFDIVALQEVFDAQRRDDLIGRAAGQHHVFPGPPAISLSLNPFDPALPEGSAGLLLLVRRSLSPQGDSTVGGPIGGVLGTVQALIDFEHRSEVFSDCSGNFGAVVTGTEPDCLAQKGFTLDKVQLGGLSTDHVYVVNTHTDAGSGSANAEARANQLGQIMSSIAASAASTHPVILMGDFNLAGDVAAPSEYSGMLQTLGAEDLFRIRFPDAQLWPGWTFDNQLNAYAFSWEDGDDTIDQQRIDYILVRQGSEYRIVVDSIAVEGDGHDERADTSLCRRPGFPVSGWVIDNPSLNCYLSDHFGLKAELRLVKP